MTDLVSQRELEEINKFIEEKLDRGLFKRTVESAADVEAIVRLVKNIETVFDRNSVRLRSSYFLGRSD